MTVPPWETWQLGLCVAVAAGLQAYLAAAEAAFLSVNDVRVQQRAEGGDPRAAFLAQHLADREGVLAFMLLLSKLAFGLLILALLRLLADFQGDLGRAVALLLCVAAVFLVFGQRLPAVLGSRHADRLAAPLLWPLRHLGRPPLSLISSLARRLLSSTGRFLGSPLAGMEPGFQLDELRLLLEASENRGVLDAESHRMLQAILGLGQIPVRRAMLPLEDTVMMPRDSPVLSAARRAAETGFSRLPIHGAERAEVVGYVHVIDLLLGAARMPEQRVDEVRQEILRVAPEDSLVSALRLFRSSRYHMAAVIDPEDETRSIGMLTIEDVLERIVGDIRDEHDNVAGAVRAAGEGVWVTDPLALLEDLERVTGLQVPSGRYRTLGGYLLHSQGEGWRHGKPLVIGTYRVTITDPAPLGAPRVTIESQPQEDPEA